MRFTVYHETLYRYSTPVGLAPHVVRLTPRADGGALVSRSLTFDPAPSARTDQVDVWGNPFTRAEFAGLSDRLRIESRFTFETRPVYWPSGLAAAALPWGALHDGPLGPYLPAEVVEPQVTAFARALAEASGWEALGFLDRLSQTLHAQTKIEYRVSGDAQAPGETLASGVGACRDLTALFMAACRSLGIPTRFVSGYQAQAESSGGRRDLHAWPEAHLPGVGWLGYDPTHGTQVLDDHVALAAAPDQGATMPVEGGFYANGVTATLDYDVRIETGA